MDSIKSYFYLYHLCLDLEPGSTSGCDLLLIPFPLKTSLEEREEELHNAHRLLLGFTMGLLGSQLGNEA